MDIFIRWGSGEGSFRGHPALVTTMCLVGISALLGRQVAARSHGGSETELLNEHPGALDGLRAAAQQSGHGGVGGGHVATGAAVGGGRVRVSDIEGRLDADTAAGGTADIFARRGAEGVLELAEPPCAAVPRPDGGGGLWWCGRSPGSVVAAAYGWGRGVPRAAGAAVVAPTARGRS